MTDDSGAHHVEVDVPHAIPEVGAGFDHGHVKSAIPESSTPAFRPVVMGPEFTLEVLHEYADRHLAKGFDKKVRVIGGDAVVQHADLEAAHRRMQPAPIFPAHAIGSKEKAAVVATVG
jgi:hypothetical protein